MDNVIYCSVPRCGSEAQTIIDGYALCRYHSTPEGIAEAAAYLLESALGINESEEILDAKR